MSIRTWFWKTFLPLAIKKQCPNTIPRSGEKGRRVDCLTIYINSGTNPYFLVDGINGDILVGRRWDGSSFSINFEIKISEINNSNIEIWFYKGMYEYTYRSLVSYLFLYIFGIHRLYTFIEIIADHLLQFFNNKRKVESLKRYDLLLKLKEHYSDGSPFSSTNFMTDLYSWRILRRPDYSEKSNLLKTQLEWLCETGDLTKIENGRWKISGHLWKTISDYEMGFSKEVNEKKHRTAISLLTVIIALSALVQAKLIKIPIMIELENWSDIYQWTLEIMHLYRW